MFSFPLMQITGDLSLMWSKAWNMFLRILTHIKCQLHQVSSIGQLLKSRLTSNILHQQYAKFEWSFFWGNIKALIDSSRMKLPIW